MTRAAERVRNVRERLFAAGTVVAGADGRPRELFPIAIGLGEGLALRDRVRNEGARTTLEVGLGYGIATLFICEGLLENGIGTWHVAIDPYQFAGPDPQRNLFAGIGVENLEEAGVREMVEFHPQESQIVLPRLLADGRRFDLAFIDGTHRFEGVFLDLIYAGRLLEERGIVFVDDAQLPAVRKAIDFCVVNLGWIVEDEGAEGDAHAWTVLRTGGHDVFLRPYTRFVDF
jgi:predicted O-methyltransferase YrrM